jgi:predicted nucleic acid-binding protein
MLLFVDSWGWIAVRNRRDPYHEQVKAISREAFQNRRIITTDFVLAETITHLYSRYGGDLGEQILDELLSILQQPEIRVEQITPERFQATIELRKRYKDKPRISFTDLSSMVVMRELGITEVLTQDEHFKKVNLGFVLLP